MGDSDRGFLLELMLTKLRYKTAAGGGAGGEAGSPGASSCQIIGMSATMPNVAQVASWLGAELFITDFRPVPLEKCLLVLQYPMTLSWTLAWKSRQSAHLLVMTILQGFQTQLEAEFGGTCNSMLHQNN